jgi:hypothetical protein
MVLTYSGARCCSAAVLAGDSGEGGAVYTVPPVGGRVCGLVTCAFKPPELDVESPFEGLESSAGVCRAEAGSRREGKRRCPNFPFTGLCQSAVLRNRVLLLAVALLAGAGSLHAVGLFFLHIPRHYQDTP